MTRRLRWRPLAACLSVCVIALGLGAAVASADANAPVLSVTLGGDGSGTVTSDSGGIDCTTGTCTATFAPGDSVTLTATPAAGSAFTGFGDACAGQACTLVMSDDATVTADFDQLPTITSPVTGTDYPVASVPAAEFTCAVGDSSCTADVDGQPVTSPTWAAAGAHTLTVKGTAADGGTVTATASYTVSPPPTASITAPQEGGSYDADAVPNADFACLNGANSSVQTCAGVVDGHAVAEGGVMPNSPGSHTLTVTATDADGSSSPQATATYTVYPPPTCRDVGTTTNEGVPVPVPVACSDPNAPINGYAIDRQPRHGSISRPHGTITYTPDAGFAGTDSFTYHGNSSDGTSATQTAAITVLAPPTAHIAAPGAGQVYTVGQTVPTSFSCVDDPAGPGLRSCADSRGASDGTGTLDTSTEGAHTYSVTAVSQDGQVGTANVRYTVVGKSPDVVITAPVNNAAYLWSALPAADFTCVPGMGSSIQSCKAAVDGQPISDGQSLPNAFGTHTLSVTATDADGLSSTQTAIYTATNSTILLAPVSIQAPAQGASYRLGQAVAARYSCAVTTIGPALKSCVGTVPAGHDINTRTLGRHTFSVSATNAQGDSTTETVTYSVVPTTNRFAVARVRAMRSGAARLALKLPGPGFVRALATAWNAAAGASARHLPYGTASVGARRGGPLSLVVAPTAAGRVLLRTRGARPVIALTVTYTPTGARPRVIHPRPLRLRAAKRSTKRSSRPTGRR